MRACILLPSHSTALIVRSTHSHVCYRCGELITQSVDPAEIRRAKTAHYDGDCDMYAAVEPQGDLPMAPIVHRVRTPPIIAFAAAEPRHRPRRILVRPIREPPPQEVALPEPRFPYRGRGIRAFLQRVF